MTRRLPLITFLLATLAVSGIATSAAAIGPVTFSPTGLDFGSADVGTTSSEQTIDITNSGSEDLVISSVDIGGLNPDSFQISRLCSGTLTAGSTCTVGVQFKPKSAGSLAATLDINYDNGGGATTDSAPLTGTGTSAPTADASPTSLSFGDQKVGTSSPAQTVTLTNNGDVVLDVSAVSRSGSDAASFDIPVLSNDCSGASVQPGQSCTFAVLFTPDSAGAKSGIVSITSNDPASPAAIGLSGNGTVPVASPPSTLSFSTPINSSETKTVTLTNTGDAPLVIQSAALTGDATFTKVVTATPCGDTTLAPGDTCTVDITFSPTSNAGQNATLTFTDDSNSVSGSTQAVSITGTVLIPGIDSNPTSVAFGQLPLGRISLPITVTVTNRGNATLHISSIVIGGINYRSFRLGAESCTQAGIVPGDTCSINVRFSPVQLGTRVANLLIRNDAGGSPSTLSVALSGVAVRPAPVTSLHGAVGCIDARISWSNPVAIGFTRVQVVRNSARIPRGPFDGVIIKHLAGYLADSGLAQFHTYHYALYAVYIAFDRVHLVYSAASVVSLHTGRICTPRNGGIIADLSPAVDWTSYVGAQYYAYILQRFGNTILVRYPKRSQTTIPSSWTFDGRKKSIQHGGRYFFYLYAYTAGRPNGFLIGQTVFTVR